MGSGWCDINALPLSTPNLPHLLPCCGCHPQPHSFPQLLGADYTFPSHYQRLNNVPFCLYLMTHGYFAFYHVATNLLMRKVDTTMAARRAPVFWRRVAVGVVVFVMGERLCGRWHLCGSAILVWPSGVAARLQGCSIGLFDWLHWPTHIGNSKKVACMAPLMPTVPPCLQRTSWLSWRPSPSAASRTTRTKTRQFMGLQRSSGRHDRLRTHLHVPTCLSARVTLAAA